VLKILLLFLILLPTFSYGGTFQATGSLKLNRTWQVATTLDDGRVLVSGGCAWNAGCYSVNSAEVYDPVSGTFSLVSNMNQPRTGHSATVLPITAKTVLVAGGNDNSAELFDPVTNSFTSLASQMNEARTNHSAVQITAADGKKKVLLIGGDGLKTTEIFDPETLTFTASGSMSVLRNSHAAVVLKNGKVLVTGGSFTTTAEIYDPLKGLFTLTNGTMISSRSIHNAQLLSDGKVLVAGGKGSISGTWSLETAELFDPDTGLFVPTVNTSMERTHLLSSPRALFSMALLADGSSFIVGGTAYPEQFPHAVLTSERYDPLTGGFNADGSTIYSHSDNKTSTVSLKNGSILLAGGYGSKESELYIPSVSSSSPMTFIAQGETHQDALTSSTPVKSYPVTFTEARNIGVSLKNDSSVNPTWNVRVSDALGQTLLYFPVTWFDMQHVAVRPGTYTIEISNSSASYNNQYLLTLYSTPVENFEKEPNDSIIGELAGISSMSDGVNYRGRIQRRESGGDIDQYKLVLPVASVATVNFGHDKASGSWDIGIAETGGTEQYHFTSAGTELAKTDKVALPAGTYLVSIAAKTATVTDIPYGVSVSSSPETLTLNARASHSGGTYNGALSVSLTTDKAASIYYTVDGSIPTILPQLKYTAAIPITTSQTLRFFARDDSTGVSEPLVTVVYIIRPGIDLTFAGNATGSVTFMPSGTVCTTNCRTFFDAGTDFTITAGSVAPTTVFAGWESLCSGTLPCQSTLGLDKTLKAYFYDSPVRIKSSLTHYYAQIQQACANSSPGSIIEARLQDYYEDLVFNYNRAVTIKGGFDSQFGSQSDASIIHGSITISVGTVTIDNLAIL